MPERLVLADVEPGVLDEAQKMVIAVFKEWPNDGDGKDLPYDEVAEEWWNGPRGYLRSLLQRKIRLVNEKRRKESADRVEARLKQETDRRRTAATERVQSVSAEEVERVLTTLPKKSAARFRLFAAHSHGQFTATHEQIASLLSVSVSTWRKRDLVLWIESGLVAQKRNIRKEISGSANWGAGQKMEAMSTYYVSRAFAQAMRSDHPIRL